MIYTLPPTTLEFSNPKTRVEIVAKATAESPRRNSFRSRDTATTPPENETSLKEGNSTIPKYKIDFVEKKNWTKSDERKFLSYARKEALDTINEVESIELEKLDRMRNALNSQRSFREILAAKRQFEKADKLIHALNEYLETTY
jgi:hypothetical protein